MARFLHQFDTFTIRRNRNFLLALSWALGLGFGALTFRYGQDRIVSLMPSVLLSRLSIVGLAASALLPFLLSVIAVYYAVPLTLTIICFAKAFLYAYISCGICQAFGDSGWLVRWLLLFVDNLTIPVLYLYWLRHISGCRRFRPEVTVLYLAVLIVMILTGHACIPPLVMAISF